MKALFLIRHGAPERAFELREVGDPRPGAGELRVATELSGINFADVMARQGLYPDAPKPPSVLGYEVVGRVESVGPGVDSRWMGKRVVALTRFGGYAEQALASIDACIEISEQTPAIEAASLATQFATAYYCAEELVRLHSGDRVLVQAAAGGVGTGLVQLAKRRGCEVFGVVSSRAKLPVLAALGVDHPIVSSETDFAEDFLRLSSGKKADVVFDSFGGRSFRKGWNLLGSGGRLVGLGVSEMSGRWGALSALRALFRFGIYHPVQLLGSSRSILGVNLLRIADDRRALIGHCMREAEKLYREGVLRPVPGRVYPVSEAAEAHRSMESRASTGKLGLSWGRSG